MAKGSQKTGFRVVICGNYGATNLGDEAVLAGILKILKLFFKPEEIAVLSYNPAETQAQHGVKAFYLLPFGVRSVLRGVFQGKRRETRRVIKEAEYFVLGGGTLFTDEWFLPVFLWGGHLRMAQRFNRKTIFLGGGVGPLKKGYTRLIVGRLMQKMDLILVRDKASQRLLGELGVKDVKVTGDPAFLLELDPVESAGEAKEPEQKSDSYVVVSLRERIKKVNNWAEKWARMIDDFNLKYGVKFVLLPFQKIRGEDYAILNNIFEHVARKEAVKIQKFSSDLTEVLRLFSQAKMVVGMRLHSLIFAFLTGKPMVALSYSDKVESLVKETGLIGQMLKLGDFDEQRLTSLLEETWQNREKLQSEIQRKAAVLKQSAQRNIEYLECYFN